MRLPCDPNAVFTFTVSVGDGNITAPQPDETLSGIVHITGWAQNTPGQFSPIQAIEIFVLRGEDKWVLTSIPYSDTDNGHFSYDWDCRPWGKNAVTLVCRASTGTEWFDMSVPVYVGPTWVGSIDAPSSNSTIGGTVNINGWVGEESGAYTIQAIELRVVSSTDEHDGQTIASLPYFKSNGGIFSYDWDTSNSSYSQWMGRTVNILARPSTGDVWSDDIKVTNIHVVANSAPNQPTNQQPSNGTTGVSLTPSLAASAFSDPDNGDTHTATEWEIRDATGAVTIWNSGTDTSHLTSVAVPSETLDASTTYSWHVRYRDAHSAWSAWSTPFTFTTIVPHNITVNAGANPTAVASGGTTQLSASATDNLGHSIASWHWSDNGAGGTFSNANSQNPTWTAPGNLTSTTANRHLTVNATCSGASSISRSAETTVTENARLFALTVTADPLTGGTASGSGSYTYNQNASISAAVNAGWRFAGWTGGVADPNATSTTVTMNADRSVTAHFIQRFALTTTALPVSTGTVSGAGTYDSGTVVTVQATPEVGYTFTGWSGALSGTTNPTTVTMTANKSITANFAHITYTLTTTASPSTGGSVSGAGTYDGGTTATVQAKPATGYRFTGWTGALAGMVNPTTLVMDTNKAVTATFSRAPMAPTDLTATALSYNQIRLDWSFSGTVTGFKIYRRVGAGAWGTTPIKTVGNTVRSFTNTGLLANTLYTYRICAYNGYGTSPASEEASATTMIFVAAPTTLVAKAASANLVNLTWVDKSANETGFNIERRLGTTGAWEEIGTVGAGVRAYTDTTVDPNTSYGYRVRAVADDAVSAYSNIASVKTPIFIAAPTDLVATPASATSISLTWTDNADNETGYKIERRLSTATTWTVVKTTLVNVTSFTNTGLTTGRSYVYRVRAYRSTTYSGYSNEASTIAQERGQSTGE
jgi:uncharacterized repeat protein (TIGR02543 family)